MSGRHPKISAVIPAYNSARYLPRAIDSVRNQTHPVDEIIVVDDGSTDDTGAVVSKLRQEIRYLAQENQGPAAARNAGVAAATGELIAFLDADDEWPADKTAKQLAVLDNNPDVALVAGDMAQIDAGGTTFIASWFDYQDVSKRVRAWDRREIPNAAAEIVRKNFIPTGTVVVRKRVLEEVSGFRPDLRYGEDLELWARIASIHPIVCLPDTCLRRRRHETNVTAQTEPLLVDMVAVANAIAAWGGHTLRAQGTDPSEMIASAYADLGYWYFTQAQWGAARRAFRSSLRTRFSNRALIYDVALRLPNPWVARLRRGKQVLAERRVR